MNKKLLVTVTVILFGTEMIFAQSETEQPVQQVETVKAPDYKDFSSMEEYSKAKEAWVNRNEPRGVDSDAIIEQTKEVEGSGDSHAMPADGNATPKQ
jgi:hypothetical protein